jgi:hypothetical protein
LDQLCEPTEWGSQGKSPPISWTGYRGALRLDPCLGTPGPAIPLDREKPVYPTHDPLQIRR